MVILTPFPAPNSRVEHALNVQRIAHAGHTDEHTTSGQDDVSAKPWDPASCPHDLRQHLWLWLDQVVQWINHDYLWRSSDLIPECWPQHPHIANELAALACLRVSAGQTHQPHELEDWHRKVLPDFLDRMHQRLGEGGCRTGKHVDWPAAARHHHAGQPEAVQARRTAFQHDTAARQLSQRRRPATEGEQP